jgi:hypothetical protein
VRNTDHLARKIYRGNVVSLLGQKSRESSSAASDLPCTSTLIRNKPREEPVIYPAKFALALRQNCDTIKLFANLLH